LKHEHFKLNYERELMKPAKYMEEIEFRDKNVDGTKFFELKYFLTNDQIEAKLKEFGSFIA